MANDSKAVEMVLASAMVEHAAHALAAAEGYDFGHGKPAVQAEYRRQARVALGAGIEYMVENNVRVVS